MFSSYKYHYFALTRPGYFTIYLALRQAFFQKKPLIYCGFVIDALLRVVYNLAMESYT